MSWQGEMVTILRQLVGDTDPDSYRYSDNRLETTILVAAQTTLSEIDFEKTYVVDVERCYISPDPTEATVSLDVADRDDGFINLVCLKAACLITNAEWIKESRNAVRVSNGPSSIDYTQVAAQFKSMSESFIRQYEDYKFALKAGAAAVGKVVLTPYSPGSDVAFRQYDTYRGYFR